MKIDEVVRENGDRNARIYPFEGYEGIAITAYVEVPNSFRAESAPRVNWPSIGACDSDMPRTLTATHRGQADAGALPHVNEVWIDRFFQRWKVLAILEQREYLDWGNSRIVTRFRAVEVN